MQNFTRTVAVIAALVTMGFVVACAQTETGNQAHQTQSAAPDPGRPATVEHLIIDTGVDDASLREFHADWPFDVNDPHQLYDFSSAVLSGEVTGIERSFVDGNGMIVTSYTVKVGQVYKGQSIPEVISLTLPGGTVPLAEYISSLDKLGLYDMKLGQKSPELLRSAGLDPSAERDPRAADPATPVSENWGMNPVSKSLLRELQPEAWVFYIGEIESDTYYGAAFDHALSYLKGGKVFSVNHESAGSPIPESELLEK